MWLRTLKSIGIMPKCKMIEFESSELSHIIIFLSLFVNIIPFLLDIKPSQNIPKLKIEVSQVP